MKLTYSSFAQYLEENLAAAQIKLPEQDIAAVRKVAEKSNVVAPGMRYPDWFKFSFQTTPPLKP